jgi:hypothetical protein
MGGHVPGQSKCMAFLLLIATSRKIKAFVSALQKAKLSLQKIANFYLSMLLAAK